MDFKTNEFTIAMDGLDFCKDCKQRFVGCVIREVSPASLLLTKIQIANTSCQNRPLIEYFDKDRYKCVSMLHRDFRGSGIDHNQTIRFKNQFVEELRMKTKIFTDGEWTQAIGDMIKGGV
jgi:hypothetical protein